MADHVVPHFHNDAGVPVIEIGSQEFMCVGANPPFDHPHVFLDLGNDNEIICPYCSTLYRYRRRPRPGEARPPECVVKDKSPDRPVAASRTIFIAGAGIGGLTASLALAAQGFRVVMLEKAERLEEVGAGLQLSPNASRVLVDLGVQGAAWRARGHPRRHQPHERARRRRDRPPAARRSRQLARRRALLGGASRRPAGGAAGARQRPSRHRSAARLPVRGRHHPRQGH